MISIVLLLKIIGVIIVAAGWLWVYHDFRRRLLRLEHCRERCEARLDTLTQLTEKTAGEDMPEADLAEARQKALEAEHRFTEGIASILNFSHTSAQADIYSPQNVMPADLAAGRFSTTHQSETGRRGEQ